MNRPHLHLLIQNHKNSDFFRTLEDFGVTPLKNTETINTFLEEHKERLTTTHEIDPNDYILLSNKIAPLLKITNSYILTSIKPYYFSFWKRLSEDYQFEISYFINWQEQKSNATNNHINSFDPIILALITNDAPMYFYNTNDSHTNPTLFKSSLSENLKLSKLNINTPSTIISDSIKLPILAVDKHAPAENQLLAKILNNKRFGRKKTFDEKLDIDILRSFYHSSDCKFKRNLLNNSNNTNHTQKAHEPLTNKARYIARKHHVENLKKDYQEKSKLLVKAKENESFSQKIASNNKPSKSYKNHLSPSEAKRLIKMLIANPRDFYHKTRKKISR